MRNVLALLLAIALPAQAIGADAPYLTKEQVEITHLLAPPPVPGTSEQQRDLAAVLVMQAGASDAERARAIADADESIFRFADVLGRRFRKERLPVTRAFFERVQATSIQVTTGEKAHWHHPRPIVLDPNIRMPGPVASSVCNTKPDQPGTAANETCPLGVSYSYPSGHSTMATEVAILLGEMVPEKREALLLRGRQYGESRIINGVHFPTDIEAGRVQGTVIVALMMQNAQFRADLAEAKAELRSVLGLGPAR